MRLDARYLPALLQEFVEVIGLPATLKLVEHFGGIRIRPPVAIGELTAEHALVRALGLPAARALSLYTPGAEITVPRCLAAIRRVRDAEMRRAHNEDGVTAARLARAHALTERQVYAILALPFDNEDSRQAALF